MSNRSPIYSHGSLDDASGADPAGTAAIPSPKVSASADPARSSGASQRLVSVDALRGFDMFWIVGAGVVVQALDKMHSTAFTSALTLQLKHVDWEGFHFYDLIFPLFLFIIGVSLVFSLDKALAEGGRARVLARVFRRSLLLLAIGVFYYGGLTDRWPKVQIGGVLPRIALCYFGAALIYAFVRSARGLLAAAAALLIGYWALMTFVPFPDLLLKETVVRKSESKDSTVKDSVADEAVLKETEIKESVVKESTIRESSVRKIAAQIGSDSPSAIAAAVPQRIHGVYEEGRNLCNYLDFLFLPGKKAQEYYINEGLLSTIPSIALSLFGAMAGLLLKNVKVPPLRKVVWLLVAGAAGIGLGLLWSAEFPLIKRIWTSSFILLTSGLSALLLALFYYVVDVLQWRKWCQPFVWIGCNALTIYVTAQVVSFKTVAARFAGGDVKHFFDTRWASGAGDLVIALVSLLFVFLFARFLYRRGIFLRV